MHVAEPLCGDTACWSRNVLCAKTKPLSAPTRRQFDGVRAHRIACRRQHNGQARRIHTRSGVCVRRGQIFNVVGRQKKKTRREKRANKNKTPYNKRENVKERKEKRPVTLKRCIQCVRERGGGREIK